MNESIPELDRKGLREFGLVTGGVIAALFGMVLPWIFEFDFPRWPWFVGGTLALWGAVWPLGLKPVYRHWMRFALVLSRITTPLIMGIVFFLVITPFGLIMRAIRRDTMARAFDKTASSYRVDTLKRGKEQMERPF